MKEGVPNNSLNVRGFKTVGKKEYLQTNIELKVTGICLLGNNRHTVYSFHIQICKSTTLYAKFPPPQPLKYICCIRVSL